MVSQKIVSAANAELPKVVPNGATAVFIGATSGIGQSALEQFTAATKDKSPHIYVVGRSASKAVELLATLRQSNASAQVEFIEQDVSLVRSVDAVADFVRSREEKVDLLFLSPGFIPFHGRKETSEGLEPSMTTRYYSRIRAIQLLLPLLERSPAPHVSTVLGAGTEGALAESDLDLKQPANFSFISASVHSATMLTLSLERLAAAHPRVTFVHSFPGFVATPTLTRGSSGLVALLLRWVVSPIVNALFASSAKDAGARALFYATNARYTVPELAGAQGVVPMPQGLERARQTPKGLFLVGADGETADNEKVLGDLRARMTEKVWEHTQEVFERVGGRD